MKETINNIIDHILSFEMDHPFISVVTGIVLTFLTNGTFLYFFALFVLVSALVYM